MQENKIKGQRERQRRRFKKLRIFPCGYHRVEKVTVIYSHNIVKIALNSFVFFFSLLLFVADFAIPVAVKKEKCVLKILFDSLFLVFFWLHLYQCKRITKWENKISTKNKKCTIYIVNESSGPFILVHEMLSLFSRYFSLLVFAIQLHCFALTFTQRFLFVFSCFFFFFSHFVFQEKYDYFGNALGHLTQTRLIISHCWIVWYEWDENETWE